MTIAAIARHPDCLFIGGEWGPAAGGGRIAIVSPDSEAEVAGVAEGSEADMDRAVEAARDAFDKGPWPNMSPGERAAFLHKMAAYLTAAEPRLAQAWTAQVGGLATHAPGMTTLATMTFSGIAAMADSFEFESRRVGQMVGGVIVRREPVGVVAAIAPWNAPYFIMAAKVANALLAGCTVVMKPAPETPLEAYIIAEAAEAAELPPGVLNLVCGHRDAADYLVRHDGVDKVSFTGSTATGKHIGAVCAGRVARCTLELGGKSAAIVRDDFPTADAAALLAGTISMMSGQVCAMLSRAIVPRKRHDELAEAIADEMRKIRVGASTDPETQMGPVAMKRQLEKVEGYIAEGRLTADLITGGERPAHLNRGYFIEPTLFANVDNRSRIAQEEIFGPVLCLIPAEDEDDAIRIANESRFGLSGAVLTHDVDAAYDIARRVRTGTMNQNGIKLELGVPFGGYKQSGIGREGGPDGLMAYLETKTILLDGLPGAVA